MHHSCHKGHVLQVLPVPSYYLTQHQLLLSEFQNSTHWPKHLLVRYRWAHSNALNINAAMYVLFGLGKYVPRTRSTTSCHHVGCRALTDLTVHLCSCAMLQRVLITRFCRIISLHDACMRSYCCVSCGVFPPQLPRRISCARHGNQDQPVLLLTI